MELAADDIWRNKGYNGGPIEPGGKPAVLVIDLQNLHTDHESPLAGASLIDKSVEATASLLGVAREKKVPIYHTTVSWRTDQELGLWSVKIPWLRNVTPDSHWAAVDERLWEDSDVFLSKLRPSIFHGTPLHSLLTYAQRDTVIICGATTSGCVRASVIDAMSNNYRALVPQDCVGDHDTPPHNANLLDMQRKYAEITTSSDVVRYLKEL